MSTNIAFQNKLYCNNIGCIHRGICKKFMLSKTNRVMIHFVDERDNCFEAYEPNAEEIRRTGYGTTANRFTDIIRRYGYHITAFTTATGTLE